MKKTIFTLLLVTALKVTTFAQYVQLAPIHWGVDSASLVGVVVAPDTNVIWVMPNSYNQPWADLATRTTADFDGGIKRHAWNLVR
ncbi:MAG: hypothetical protein ACKOX3_06515, partial [Bacteroidota bacterium]